MGERLSSFPGIEGGREVFEGGICECEKEINEEWKGWIMVLLERRVNIFCISEYVLKGPGGVHECRCDRKSNL